MGPNTPPDDAIVDEVVNADRVDEANYQYYEEHSDELMNEYGGQLIAIIDSEVVASREHAQAVREIQEFFNELRREHGEHDARQAYITHVPDSDEVLLL